MGTLDFKQIGEGVQSAYAGEVATRYRENDELEITTPNHLHLGSLLAGITAAFGRPISVLEIGCGTGRYFHCLRNVERLVGVDVSPDMLELARHPVREEQVTARNIELRHENIYTTEFAPRSFDFIYSLGVLGGACPFTPELANKLHDMLTPDGVLFFNVIDREAAPLGVRTKARVRGFLRGVAYPLLPRPVQQVLDERKKRGGNFSMTRGELEAVMRGGRFGAFSLSSHVCESPLWTGTHIECTAWKSAHPLG